MTKTTKYPTHEEIRTEIVKHVFDNLSCEQQHHRENLDDIISDLIQYRDTLPTPREYMAVNEL